MPVTIALRFPAGRYHATLWGQHVNDEQPEWPPSPWRLLRALAAVWMQKCSDDPLVSRHVATVFGGLAAESPHFQLPRATQGHTRHYMPERSKPTLVLDRFVAVPRPPKRGDDATANCTVYVHWPVTLFGAEERSGLARMLERLTYLGRGESWCDAQLLPERFPVHPNCYPSTRGPANTRVLVPDARAWERWDYGPSVNRPDPPWNLMAESADVQAAGFEVPPGARWETYSLPPLALAADVARSVPTPLVRHQMTVARFLLDGPVLPLVTDAVRVAEAFRAVAMSHFNAWGHRQPPDGVEQFRRIDRNDQYRSQILSGKDVNARFLPGHNHAHYLPTAEGDDRRRVTHVTVYAPGGFGAGETAALTGLRKLKVGDLELRTQLVGLGRPSDFRAALFGGVEGAARVWTSATPYVGPVHIGRSERDRYLRKALRRELRRQAPLWPAGAAFEAVEVIAADDPVWSNRPRPFEFKRGRNRAGDDGYRRPFGAFRVTFSVPIPGPLCLGYASHFGLGLFVPAE